MLNQDQLRAFQEIENHTGPIFVTGKAGTGKSYLLRHLAERSKDAGKILKTAFSGLAALNAEGVTLHSVILNAKFSAYTEGNAAFQRSVSTKNLLSNLKMLIIDEISMVRADMMDAIDRALRWAKNSDEAFGGVRIVMFGDLYQLPPFVVERDLNSHSRKFLMSYEDFDRPYFFEAHVFKIAPIKQVELGQVERIQVNSGAVREKQYLLDVLNRIRLGEPDFGDANYINKFRDNVIRKDAAKLFGRNAPAKAWNEQMLKTCPGPDKTFEAVIDARYGYEFFWENENNHPAELELTLRVGAKVMFIRNDPDGKYVNGTIGNVVEFRHNEVIVNVNGNHISAFPTTWTEEEAYFDGLQVTYRSKGTFTQIPLKLAWALSIHKAQGQTLEEVSIDFSSDYFAAGQAYVALSRVTSPEGLHIEGAFDPVRHLLSPSKMLKNFLAQDSDIRPIFEIADSDADELAQRLVGKANEFGNNLITQDILINLAESEDLVLRDLSGFNHLPRAQYLMAEFGLSIYGYLLALAQVDMDKAATALLNAHASQIGSELILSRASWANEDMAKLKNIDKYLDQAVPGFVEEVLQLSEITFDDFISRLENFVKQSNNFKDERDFIDKLVQLYKVDKKKFQTQVRFIAAFSD